MIEQKTTELEVENQAENETLENAETKHPETQGGEENPYAKQLEELKAREKELQDKLAAQEEIIKNKNRAIESTKSKLKESIPSEDELIDKLTKRLEEKSAERSIQQKIAALTEDPAERELIVRHYQSSIVKTGNMEDDLKSAIALAERDRIWEQRRNRALEEHREDFITGFAGTSLRGDSGTSKTYDPIHAAAAEIVRAVNPKAVEQLNNYFKK